MVRARSHLPGHWKEIRLTNLFFGAFHSCTLRRKQLHSSQGWRVFKSVRHLHLGRCDSWLDGRVHAAPQPRSVLESYRQDHHQHPHALGQLLAAKQLPTLPRLDNLQTDRSTQMYRKKRHLRVRDQYNSRTRKGFFLKWSMHYAQ